MLGDIEQDRATTKAGHSGESLPSHHPLWAWRVKKGLSGGCRKERLVQGTEPWKGQHAAETARVMAGGGGGAAGRRGEGAAGSKGGADGTLMPRCLWTPVLSPFIGTVQPGKS